MGYAFLIDTTVCTGCRACQVACKQWHDLPAETTTNRGSYQNPADLSFSTYKLVRMTETVLDGQLKWLFFPDQCRHCLDAPCLETVGDSTAIYRDAHTGAVLYTTNTKEYDGIAESCPYNIPRTAQGGVAAKCDMCNDRVHNGLLPACVQTCPTGAMSFGPRADMRKQADRRLAQVKGKFPQASLIDADNVRVIYLVAYAPMKYHENAMAANTAFEMNRAVALRRMTRPYRSFVSRLMGG